MVFDVYFERLYVFSFNLIRNGQEVEDIASKAQTSLFARSDLVVGLPNICSLLYTSVKNASFDCLRKLKCQPTKSLEEFYRLVNDDAKLIC